MEFDSRDLVNFSTLNYDICIIGGGIAGITIAKELSDSGKRVALLESGGYESDEATQNLYSGVVNDDDILFHPDLDKCRDRYYGGSSNTWGGYSIPLDYYDFQNGLGHVVSDWPISFSEHHKNLERACSYLEIGLNNFGDPSIDEHPFLIDEIESSDRLVSDHIKFSSPVNFKTNYSDFFKNSTNVDVYLWANTVNLGFDEINEKVKRSVQKTLNGKTFYLNADEFILCTGGIEVPRLLLSSNDVISNGIGNQNGLVGKYYSTHPVFYGGLFWKSPSINVRNGRTLNYENVEIERVLKIKNTIKNSENISNIFFWMSNPSSRFSDIISPKLSYYKDNQYIDSLFVVGSSLDMIQSYNNSVQLGDELDDLGMKKVVLDFHISDQDIQNVIDSYKILSSEFAKLGLGRMSYTDDIEDMKKSYSFSRAHHMGTTRMASSSAKGVVDSNCKVFGTKNLYISSSSIFSTSGAANPTLSLLSLSIRLADYVRAL